jgi:phenylacetate-CoA ligase
LRKALAYVYEKSVFYRDLFDRNSIKPDSVSSLADLARIPFTSPADLAAHPYNFACVSLGEMERVTTFTSSGTTGPQKRVFFSQNDLETMTDFMAAAMKTVAKEGDVVQIMLPSLRPNDQADLLAKGVKKMGGVPIITGTAPTSEAQLKVVDESHPAVLFASVSRMYRITQETKNRHDLKAKGVKTVFVTSEYLSDSMRKQLQDIWGCDVHSHYGMTEMGLGVAIDCHAHDGYHFNEADILVEVIDPVTGAVLPDGEEGELVFTTLSLEGTPLIRYCTHDISRLITRPCACGASTLKRIAPVNRRLEAIVKVGKQDDLYPALFDELIFSIPDITDYQLNLSQQGNKDALLFKIESAQQNADFRNTVTRAIAGHPLIKGNVAAATMAPPEIELVSPGTLVRLTRAKKLIIDERKEKTSQPG